MYLYGCVCMCMEHVHINIWARQQSVCMFILLHRITYSPIGSHTHVVCIVNVMLGTTAGPTHFQREVPAYIEKKKLLIFIMKKN